MEIDRINLASQPQVHRSRSRLRIALVAGLSLVMLGIGSWRLSRFISQQSLFRDGVRTLSQRQDRARQQIKAAEKSIEEQQKIWKERIDWANNLTASLSPVLIRHLNHLETLLPEQVRLDSLTFSRNDKNELSLTITASSMSALFDLYRRLAEYDLHVTSESPRKEGGYKAVMTIVLHGGKG